MTSRLRLSLFLVVVGTASAIAALIHTTAVTLGAFGALGVPCYMLAAGLYLTVVLRDLHRHDVL